ncbi:MAG: deoxyguanosinetriphosphate triphosphohydrolase [Candidatus Hydrogenedentes bacterium]|nr:deoxyguanosinetriphosphate triphosphohydrolase [Candidatus Hydrogenedentota bacterium]
MTIREALEERERQTLGSHAAQAAQSRGRLHPEPEHEYRTAFQRDRDRILHSKAFRRLKRKTQVFLAPEGDHYRTRLSHTLEAAQIARTAARALFLNEDLTEAIALGHDLGHTPFGHAGEAALNEVYEPGFRHFEQSLRIVDKLEAGRAGPGLNLTFEVRDGILNHSKGKSLFQGQRIRSAATLEGELVSICDAIAYVNHDIDDAIRGGLITMEDLPRNSIRVLGRTTSERINMMVGALIGGSQGGPISMTDEVRAATHELRNHLYEHVYPHPAIYTEITKAKKLLGEMYFRLLERPTNESAAGDSSDSLERRTVDFIAGMTDHYALQLYQQLFFPAAWPA